MNEDQKLWRRAKSIITGGNMLLSKNPERYLPDHWPAYFKKAKGCKIWGIDKKIFRYVFNGYRDKCFRVFEQIRR